MSVLPDSGDPGNLLNDLHLDTHRPALLSEATWQHLRQRYQLRGELGEGGQACVFEAKEKDAPHRRVALKVYHENTDAARKAFDNECRILASDRLPPEVVGYYQCVTEPGLQPYLMLEFIDGRRLSDLARDRRELSLTQKLDLIARLARTFDRLHQCNLVFGDASANNILIEKQGAIRFIDLAGAKELIPGHGRTRSSVNLVTPGFVPQTAEDSTIAKAVRTTLATDLYALAANAFLLLTGRTEADVRGGVSSREAARLWDAALAHAGVPGGVRGIILKGLRVPDDRTEPDRRAYPTAEAFATDLDTWQTRRRQRRSALTFGLPALLCVGVLAFIAQLGWQKYEEERIAFDLRRFSALQERVATLPNASQPAIRALIADVDQLAQQRQEQLSRQQTGLAATTLRQMTQKLEQALDTSAALESCLELRTALATELISDPQDAIIPWLTANPRIQSGLKELARRNAEIRSQLDAGQTRDAYAALVTLQKDILALKRDNDRSVSGQSIRQRYDALRNTVPERLRSASGFDTIDAFAKGGLEDWNAGSWDAAERGFGQAIQKLSEWLEPQLTAAERQARESQLQADREAALREDVVRLSGERDKARSERDGLQTSLAALNETLKQKDAEIAKEQARINALTGEKSTLNEQLAALTTERDRARSDLQKKDQELIRQIAETDRWKDRADAAGKIINSLPTASSSNDSSGATQVIVDAGKIAAAIEARLKSLDTSDHNAAQKALAEAIENWQANEVSIQAARLIRETLLKTNAEDGAEVVEQDRRIQARITAGTRLEDAVRQALARRDEADRYQFDEREAAINQLIEFKAKLMGPPLKRLANHPDVIAQDQSIAKLKREQAPFAAGAARAAGTGKKLAIEEIVALSGATFGTGSLDGTKPGELKVIRVKNQELRFHWCPAGTFRMGSPTNESGRDSDENQVTVTLSKGFWMLETEVTQSLWTAVMGGSLDWDRYGNGSTHPVYNVSHTEAVEFCEKLTALVRASGELSLDRMITLPTEAQWEYAARAGTTTRYYWGDRDADADEYARHDGNSNDMTHPVGQKKPNAWGLHDMSGNVREWCADCYADKLPGGTDPRGPSSASNRVLRGGSWWNSVGVGVLRSAVRNKYSPGFRHHDLGFRVACSSVKG